MNFVLIAGIRVADQSTVFSISADTLMQLSLSSQCVMQLESKLINIKT